MALLKGKLLLSICFSCIWLLVPDAPPLSAAILKDVRLGDHDTFTRVVLEFDSNVTVSAEHKGIKGLVLTFIAAKVGLIRKIPDISSSRIEKLTLWEKQITLSIQIAFNLQKFGYEFLQLPEPYRLVIDVFPRGDWTSDPQTESVRHDPKAGVSTSEAQIAKSIIPDTDRERSQPGSSGSPADEEFKSLSSMPPQATQSPQVKQSSSEHIAPPDVLKPKTNRSPLQFYLIITLVGITVIILSLLVLMLLARYRWTDSQPQINMNELLRRQEDNIASLNARIEEQLKRYDEA